MEKDSYRTVYRPGQGEIVEKKSRFIATVAPAESEEEALAFIADMKKQYWDARHNCYAYAVGLGPEIQRCSDDGEPGGTAGRPMLDVLVKEEIHNAVVVVTRYFGGVLLGTGGLVRAYQKATQAGLSDSQIITRRAGVRGVVETDYHAVGKIQYILAQNEIPIADSQYAEKVRIQVVVPAAQKESFEKEINEGTGGQAPVLWGQDVWFAMVGKKLVIF